MSLALASCPMPPARHWHSSADPGDLAEIYNPAITLAVWERQLSRHLDQEIRALLGQPCPVNLRCQLDADETRIQQQLQGISGLDHWPLLTQELGKLAILFSSLFETSAIGLRVHTLDQAMCPRFHVDRVPVRLVCTYGGPGTEWLHDDAADRTRLGPGHGGHPDERSRLFQDPAAIMQIATGAVALMKGETWQDNAGRGLIHRSPWLAPDQRRLIVTLDLC